jgi:anti-sigma B factor antagonist
MNGSPTIGSSCVLEQERLADGRVILAARGVIDLFTAPELKRRLSEAVDLGTHELILDLSQTAFLDSTGLGAILVAHKRLSAAGGRLVIVPGQASVARVLEVTGMESLCAFAATRDEAVGALPRGG